MIFRVEFKEGDLHVGDAMAKLAEVLAKEYGHGTFVVEYRVADQLDDSPSLA